MLASIKSCPAFQGLDGTHTITSFPLSLQEKGNLFDRLSEGHLRNYESKESDHLLYPLMFHIVESGISKGRKTFVFSFHYNISILVKFVTNLNSK